MRLVGDPPVWVYTVTDLPAEMASGEWRGRFRPVKQFVMGWNDEPSGRETQLDGEPVGKHPFDLAVIAVTVAGLCERDGIPEPEWVDRHRWTGEPQLLIGMPVDCEWSRKSMKRAPAICSRFNVYYDDSWLESATFTRFPPDAFKSMGEPVPDAPWMVRVPFSEIVKVNAVRRLVHLPSTDSPSLGEILVQSERVRAQRG